MLKQCNCQEELPTFSSLFHSVGHIDGLHQCINKKLAQLASLRNFFLYLFSFLDNENLHKPKVLTNPCSHELSPVFPSPWCTPRSIFLVDLT